MIFEDKYEKKMWLEGRPKISEKEAIDFLYWAVFDEESTPENHYLGSRFEEFAGCILVLKDYFDSLE